MIGTLALVAAFAFGCALLVALLAEASEWWYTRSQRAAWRRNEDARREQLRADTWRDVRHLDS